MNRVDFHDSLVLPDHPRCKQENEECTEWPNATRWGEIQRCHLHKWIYLSATGESHLGRRMFSESWNTAQALSQRWCMGWNFKHRSRLRTSLVMFQGSVTTTKYHSSVLRMSVYFPYPIHLQGLPRWPQTAPQTAPGQQTQTYVKMAIYKPFFTSNSTT